MLETLLVFACIGGTTNSCLQSGDAYQKFSGLDKVIEKINKENPLIAHTFGVIGIVKEKKLYYQVYGPFYHECNLQEGTKNIAWYKKEF